MKPWMVYLKGLKWGVIGAVMLSGWIMAAWIKADLRPSRIEPLSTLRRVEIVAQKPAKGQEWATYDCVKVRYLRSKSEEVAKPSEHQLPLTSDTGTTPEGHVLPLGRFLVPASGRDPIRVTPELDPVSGETKLQVEPAGGFARFGGERYAFMDFSYQKLLQSDFALSDVPALSIGLHQDLGRIGKMELMAEGWLQASVLESQLDRSVELGVGVRLRVALPF